MNIIGHPDDQHYPVDCEALAQAAAKHHIIIEVNEASLSPGGYRGETKETMCNILNACFKYRLPILLSSDSHGAAGVGEAPLAQKLVAELHYPEELILNFMPAEEFAKILQRKETV